MSNFDYDISWIYIKNINSCEILIDSSQYLLSKNQLLEFLKTHS